MLTISLSISCRNFFVYQTGNHKNDEARVGSYLVITHLSSRSCRTRIQIHSVRHKGWYAHIRGKVIRQEKKGQCDPFSVWDRSENVPQIFHVWVFLGPCQCLSNWFPRDVAVGFWRTLIFAFSNCFRMSMLFLS